MINKWHQAPVGVPLSVCPVGLRGRSGSVRIFSTCAISHRSCPNLCYNFDFLLKLSESLLQVWIRIEIDQIFTASSNSYWNCPNLYYRAEFVLKLSDSLLGARVPYWNWTNLYYRSEFVLKLSESLLQGRRGTAFRLVAGGRPREGGRTGERKTSEIINLVIINWLISDWVAGSDFWPAGPIRFCPNLYYRFDFLLKSSESLLQVRVLIEIVWFFTRCPSFLLKLTESLLQVRVLIETVRIFTTGSISYSNCPNLYYKPEFLLKLCDPLLGALV